AEVEHALVGNTMVAEAAVIGRTDPTTGQSISAFVILRGGYEPSDERAAELREHVSDTIGPIARPKSVLFTEELPKTRSGKIMRRLLRNVAEDEQLGDTTTLADPTVVQGIKNPSLPTQGAGDAEGAAPVRSPGPGGTARSRLVRPWSSTSTECSPTPPAGSTISRRPGGTGARSSTPVVTTPSSRRSRSSSTCSTPRWRS